MNSPTLKTRLLALMDLTSLADTDTPASITALCDKALQSAVSVAAVCVYPRFIETVTTRLKNSSIQCAVVANFPGGAAPLAEVLTDIRQACQAGAQEIDVVFPYQKFLNGAQAECDDFIKQCKSTCGTPVLLKVILETGALPDATIAAAADCVIAAGADFVKTSTGKIAVGATLAAAEIILRSIKASQKNVGLKVSGGVRTLAQASAYYELAVRLMGPDWINSAHFRFGASQLFDILSTSPLQ